MSRKFHVRHHALPGAGGPFDSASGMPFGCLSVGIPLATDGTAPGWDGFAPAATPVVAPSEAAAVASPGTAPTGASAPTTTVMLAAPAATSTSGLVINVVYDSSVTTASQTVQTELQTAVNAAAQFFETTFSNPITLRIDVGWGEVGGSTTPFGRTGALGASESNGNRVSYNTVWNALVANQTSGAQSAAAGSLPANDPTTGSGNDYYVSQAEEKALGIPIQRPAAVDGAIGISSSYNFTFDPNNRALPGYYDAIGTIEHEISEVMGRTGSLGTYDGSGIYTPLDLFRYSAAGQRQLSPGSGYFSVNGQTLLTQYNNPVLGGDAADWVSTLSGDSFGFGYQGVASLVSSTDVTEMNVLGYNLTSAGANCFAAGTRILTERGEIPVEALAVGDRVVARFAGLAPIRWIGRRRIDCHRHPDPGLVRPVRIAAGAFGPGRPTRPLRLSPDHAVAVEGALIPIRQLVNNGAIAQDNHCAQVWYFHIELDRHDLVTADGLEAETYLDTGNRARFENPQSPLLLYPMAEDAAAQARRVAGSCLPLRCDPPAVEPAWRRCAARSAALGYQVQKVATTRDPALCLDFGGARLRPVTQAEGPAVFAVPPGEGPAVLLSRSVVPAALRPWQEDRRQLGVRVRALSLRRGAERIDLAPDDPRLAVGWWAPEREAAAIWRWTDGAARLPLPCGGAILEVWTGEPLDYPQLEAAAAADCAA